MPGESDEETYVALTGIRIGPKCKFADIFTCGLSLAPGAWPCTLRTLSDPNYRGGSLCHFDFCLQFLFLHTIAIDETAL